MEENKTLYSKITEYLKEKIESGEVLPNDKLPTEAELSMLFNVSRITSKRALEELEKEKLIYRKKGSGSFVAPRENTTNKIDMGSNKETNMVAIVMPFENSNVRLLETIKGASDVLTEKGYYLTVHSSWRDVQKERKIINELYKEGIKGIIYYPIYDNRNLDLIYRLSVTNYPIVTIDKYFEGTPISYVLSDNFDGAYKATTYLQKLGHKNIAYLSYSTIEAISSVRQRYFGYCKAMLDNGFELNDDYIYIGLDLDVEFNNTKDEKEQEKKLKNLLVNLINKGVTAIHAENDNLAINIINICNEIGIKVPEQLSIVGFDNLTISNFISVPLTTIEQDFYLIGKKAAEIIVQKIEGNSPEQEKLLTPVSLIERKSCIKRLE